MYIMVQANFTIYNWDCIIINFLIAGYAPRDHATFLCKVLFNHIKITITLSMWTKFAQFGRNNLLTKDNNERDMKLDHETDF